MRFARLNEQEEQGVDSAEALKAVKKRINHVVRVLAGDPEIFAPFRSNELVEPLILSTCYVIRCGMEKTLFELYMNM